MDALRIAVALPHLGVYGGIRRFFELGRVWLERGHTVALLTPEGPAPGDAWLPFGGETGRLERFEHDRWDVLLSPDPAIFARAASLAAPGTLRAFYAVLEKALGAEAAWRRADVVLANSANMRRHLARRGVRAEDGVGGVNLAFFRPPSPDPRDGRREGPVRVLIYGRLSRKRKGSMTAVRAVELASRAARVPVEVTLFDSPPPGGEKGSLPAIDVPHRWVFHPSQEELAALYRETDLFVSAERRAGWCNTAAEAMASGAAVVCTPSGTEDFARHGASALVARWPWTWSLAGPIEKLLRDPALRRRMAEGGRRAIQEFGWERTATHVEAALRQGIERKKGNG
jgi:glycosyltransferase involved in cell wall biosynthesis